MGKIILKTDIKREPDMLYYCGTDKDGNIAVGCAPMQHGGRKKKAVKNTKTKSRK